MKRVPPTARTLGGGPPERRTPFGEPATVIPVVAARIPWSRVGAAYGGLRLFADDGAHLLSIERLQGRGSILPRAAVCSATAVAVSSSGKSVTTTTSYSPRPDQLANLAAALLDQAPAEVDLLFSLAGNDPAKSTSAASGPWNQA